MGKDHKKRNAAIAGAVILLLVLASMFAWGTYQSALNEFIGSSNPDAELIDDFDPDIDKKDVYVKNTGDVPFVARIQLREFMALGDMEGAPLYSLLNGSEAIKNATPPPAFDVAPDQWSIHGLKHDTGMHDEASDPFGQWWDWLDMNANSVANTMCTYDWWIANNKPADVWVLCEDGYFYYSSVIQPGTESTQILSGVAPKFDKDAENYYYAIDVGLEVLTLRDLNPWFDAGGGVSTNGIAMNEASAAGKEVINEALRTIVTRPPSDVKISPATQSVALNEPTQPLTVSANGNGAEILDYQWFVSEFANGSPATPVGANSKNFTPPSDVEGTFYYLCLVMNVKGSTASPIVKVTVIDDPTFGTPKSLKVSGSSEIGVLKGEPPQTVTAEFDPNGAINIQYQWFVNSVESTATGNAISGATSQNFAIPTSSSGDFYYYFTLTPSNGNQVTSPMVKVVVVEAPTSVDVGPPGDQSSPRGGTDTVQLTATPNGGHGTDVFQWHVNSTGAPSGGNPVPGATSATFTPPTDVEGVFYYYATVAKKYNPQSVAVASNVVKVTITGTDGALLPPSEVNIAPNTEQNIVFGSPGNTLTVNANPNGANVLTYQWYSNTTASTNGGTAISGATSQTYVPESATRGTVFYYAIATNSKGSTTSSNTVRVNFDDGATAAPTFAAAGPTTQTLGYNTATGAVTTSVAIADPGVNNASLKYQWYSALSSSSTIGSTPLAGQTSSMLTPATNVEGTFYYYVVVSNSKAPTGVTSNIVTVIVGATSAPQGVSVTPSAPQEVDQGNLTAPLSVTVSNLGGAAPSSITYQWYSRATDSNVIAGATLIAGQNTAAFLPPFETPGVLYYFCVATNSVGSTASNTVKVEIKRVGFEPPVLGTNITLDGIEWIPIRQVTEGGKTYTLIVSRQTLFDSVYKSTANFAAWETSTMLTPTTARTNTNNWYAALDPTGEIRSRAMVPTNVRSEAAYNATVSNPAQGYSTPTAAKPTGTADIAFALSFSEANDFMTATQRISTAKAPATIVHWWLRSPGSAATYARTVNGSGGHFGIGNNVPDTYAIRPALWIK